MNYQDGYSQKALDALAKGKYKSLRSSGLANSRYTEGKKKRDNAVVKQNKTQNPAPRNTNAMANDPRFFAPSVSLPVPTLPMVSAMQNDPRYQAYDGDQVLNQLLNNVSSPVQESSNLPDMIPKAPKESGSKRSKARPATRYKNEPAMQKTELPQRDTTYDKDFAEYWDARFANHDIRDYDSVTDQDIPHWQNVKKNIMQKHGWTEEEFEKNFKPYNAEQWTKMDEEEIQGNIGVADKSHFLGALLNTMYLPQSMVEGAAGIISKLTGYENPDFVGSDPLVATRSREGMKTAATKDMGTVGSALYNIGAGQLDRAVASQIPILGTAALGAETAARTLLNAEERGVDDTKAGLQALGSGIASGFFNRVGFNKMAEGGSSPIGNVVKGAIAEGSEEGAEELFNIGLDTGLNLDKSELATLHDYYVSQGMSNGQAWWQVAKDKGIDLATSIGTGALFGGLFSTANEIPELKTRLSNVITENAKDTKYDANQRANQARVPDVVEQARAQAERAQAEVERLNQQLPEMPESTSNVNTMQNVDFKPSIHNADGQLLDTVKVPEYTADSNVFFNGSDSDIAFAEAQDAAITDTFRNIVSDPEFNALSFKNGRQEVYVSPSTNGEGYRVSYTVDGVPTGHHDYSINEIDDLSQNLREMAGNGGEDIRIQKKSDLARQTAERSFTDMSPEEQAALQAELDSEYNFNVNEVAANDTGIESNPRITERSPFPEKADGSRPDYHNVEEVGTRLETTRQSIAKNNEDIEVLNKQLNDIPDLKKNAKERSALKNQIYQLEQQNKQSAKLEKILTKISDGEKVSNKDIFEVEFPDDYHAIFDGRGGFFGRVNMATKFAGDTPEAKALAQSIRDDIYSIAKGDFDIENLGGLLEKVYNLDRMAQETKADYRARGTGKNPSRVYKYDDFFAGTKNGIGDDFTDYVIHSLDKAYQIANNMTGIDTTSRVAEAAGESAPIETPESVASSNPTIPEVTGIDNRVPTQTPVETNQVPSVVNPGITNVPPTNVGNTEDGNGRHTKTSETYINTGRYGGGWTEEEYNQNTDPSQFQYEDVGERESLEKGFGMIQDEGFDEFRDRVMDKERLSGAEIDGLMAEWRIINDNARRLEAEGKDASDVWSEGIKVFRKIQEQSTSNAQALQALAKWSRNTPEGLLTEAENIINGKKKMNDPDKSDIQKQFEKFAKRNKKFKFSDDFVSDFLNKAQELEGLDNESREAKEIMAELGKMINRQLPAKFTEKLTSYLMDSMLGNFRTLITRNAGGNIGLNAVEQFAQRPLAALIDMGVAKKTGRRTQAGLSGKGLAEYVSGFAKGLKEEAIDFKKDIHTARSGENTLANAVSQNRHVFKEKGVMDRLDKLVKHGLSVGDRPFYEAVYKQTLGDYQRLRDSGKMGDTIQSLSDEDFDMYSNIAAKTNALSAVYQQDSKLSNALLKFKNAVGDLSEGIVGVDILSQFSMPFVKTPANVIERSIDYSPLGLVRNAIRTGKELKSEGGLDQNRFVNEAARNILGTGLMAGSAALAAKGGMSGGYSEDRDEKQAQKESGMQEYALNLGDGKQMDIGWIPVVGGNAVAAAAAVDAYKKGEGNVLGNLARGAEAGGQALFDQSMFQGLQRLFGTGESYDSDSSIFGNMANVVKSGVGQAVPSIIRQINQVADPYQRDVGNSNEGISFGMFDNYDLNSLANNVPFLRQMGLAPKVNTSGELVRENQGRNIGSKILEDMILPGRVSKVDVSPLNQEAERLQEATTSSDAYMPKASRKYVDTAEHTLTNQEWTDYQQNYYGSMTEVGNRLMESDTYKSADPDEQVQMLKAGYDAIKYALQSEYSGKEVSGAAKAYEEAGGGEEGINAVIDSVTASHNPYGLDSNEYKDALEKGEDLSSLEGYKETLAENGMTNSKANQQAYKEGGAQALKTKGDIETFFHDNYGLDAPGVSSAWQNTKREFPMITEDQFNRQYRDIAGQEGDLMSVSMNEIINYITNHPNEYKANGEYNMSKVNQLWRAYKGDNWKQVPYVKKDGSLGHHKQ